MTVAAAASLASLALLQLLGSSLAASRCLDSSCQYRLDWVSSSNAINFTLTAKTSGWIGLGFSPNGGMVGSDIVMSYVDANGNVVLQDRHAVAEALPVLDQKQDYKLISGRRKDGQLIVSFTRLLDTCDSEDAVITPYTTKVIYALGNLGSKESPEYHGSDNRGVHSMYLLEPKKSIPAEDDLFAIDPIPAVITVPAEPTTYWCSLVKLPTFSNKSHIVAQEPVIWANNTDLVHHMLVYGCDSVNTNFSSYKCGVGDPAEGGGNSVTCLSLLGMWAIGGGDYVLPNEAGLPFGGTFGPQYILIQTHYNNVGSISGRTDASYIRFKVTNRLRANDAGIIQSGIVQGILVPPNTVSMNVGGYCTNSCLSSENLPNGGIRVFAVGLHSHLLGRAITLRHFRPSQQEQLPVVASDPYYDFAYQEVRDLVNDTLVLPGDILQTICTMSSSSRNVVTLGGLSTMQEMCLSFLFYYPRTNIKLCQTAPAFISPMDPLYAALNVNFTSFDWSRGSYTGLNGVNWTSESVSKIQERYFAGTNYDICVSQPVFQEPWSPPEIVRAPPKQEDAQSPECSRRTTPASPTSVGATTKVQPMRGETVKSYQPSASPPRSRLRQSLAAAALLLLLLSSSVI